MKLEERQRARVLRAQGRSMKEIERMLGVARSSVSRWVRDVELGEAEERALVERARLGPLVAARRKADAAREARRTWQQEGRRLVHEREASYVAGCMLYWAEGSKQRNSLKLVNADPELLATFVRFLRVHFQAADARLKVCCNLFADHATRQREVEDFWLGRLELPRTSLRRSTVNVRSRASRERRTNVVPRGTCAVVVDDTRLVQTIYGSIQEYGGFEQPAWLD